MIGVDWQNVSFDSITLDEESNSMLKFSFEQEIPFPGKLSSKEKIAARDSEAEEKSYQATERRVIADLKAAYYDWYLAEKAIEITERNKELLEKFTKIAEVKYEVGKGIQQDVLKAQVETSKDHRGARSLQTEKRDNRGKDKKHTQPTAGLPARQSRGYRKNTSDPDFRGSEQAHKGKRPDPGHERA